MKLEQLLQILLLTGSFVVLVRTPVLSEQAGGINMQSSFPSTRTRLNSRKSLPLGTSAQPVLSTRRIWQLSQIEHPNSKVQILAQSPASNSVGSQEVIEVTGVKVNATDKGLEVILQTLQGDKLQPSVKSEGNNLIADIPNTQLRLTSSNTFRQQNPALGITEVIVTNLDANSIRVTVAGKEGLPTVELFDSPDEGLIFSVSSTAASTQQPQTQPNPSAQQPESQTQPSQPSAETDEPIELVVTGERDTGYSAPDASTATKIDTPLRDIPQSIQVIPRRVIEDQKVTRISDAVRNVSGVTQQFGFADATDTYNIRGFSTSSILRNGFSLEDPLISSNNVERIEVLKGPGSVLYGQFEPGGIVNYVTKQPLDKPYYAAEFTAGSYSFYNPTLDISGPLTDDKRLLYRLNVGYENSGDFQDFQYRKRFEIAPTLTYRFSEDTELTLSYEYINLESSFGNQLPSDPITFKLPINRSLGEPDDFYKQEAQNVNLTLNHRFSQNWQLRTAFNTQLSNTSFARTTVEAIVDERTGLREAAQGPAAPTSVYSLQTDLIGKFNTGSVKHQLLFGVEWKQAIRDYSFFESSQTTTPSIDLFDPVYGSPRPTLFDNGNSGPYNSTTNTVGLYLQDQVTLLPNLKLLIGGRYDFIRFNDKFQSLDSDGVTSIGEPVRTNFYDEAFSPRVGIVYQPIEPVSLYASFSKAFVPNNTQTEGRGSLPPTAGTQYEVGVKTEFLDGKLSATLAAYDITKTNVAVTDPDNSDFSIAAGEVKSRGIEFDIAGEPLTGWNIIASFFVNDAFVSKDTTLPVGDTLVNAPKQGASLWTTYTLQTGSLRGLGFGAGLFYVGDREAQLPNTFQIPSYVRADAAIFYKRDNWRVGLNFKNISSTQYYDSDGGSLRAGAPFTVLGSISVQF